ncbi:CRISPR-associated helicase/endonuclease Cas3 [Anaerocolumna cellulosilytica]|uniref:CRISPR-associated helicase/endonuclease Cas3 n=1 Tax=Anaerocolumna cellulosilytica TaxID=433286 RepID=A0A6S6R8Q0_9FIRM|nr:CRISPR-associated helicase Cas3' [Anaerocolumna cellulosilytica]MBB5197118.1 CRISPR-associated endonuclease/helicase Cas3 [Anaerocolumna cellulosilytica]BCJ95331.1 CRISPR-associated helicase/endonuclease Cas3 [Anaerocolumna cellulosilytica]
MPDKKADERFIAKTKPRKDIMEHTNDLLANYEILKKIYPDINIDWYMLYLACIYHDLGKINYSFQQVMQGKGRNTGIPHGMLSLGFIDVKYLINKGYNHQDIMVLFHAVAYHHEREMNYNMDDIYDELEQMDTIVKQFEYSKLPTKYFNPEFDQKYFMMGERLYESRDNIYFYKYVMLKGLLNRIDYAASSYITGESSPLCVEVKNDFLSITLNRILCEWRKKNELAEWNDLQNYMLKNQDNNVIVIAQTGMGKTEAGLLWLGNNKGFFTLPLKSAINAIYKRIIESIVNDEDRRKVGLLHSDTLKIYAEDEKKEWKKYGHSETGDSQLEYYYTSTKQLSLPLTICTIDQIFDFVYRYKGFESKLATLSYSKIIIDEIQMYSSDLVAYLIVGLSYITKLGGKYAILTATFPRLFLDLMNSEGLVPPEPNTFTNNWIRHSIKRVEASIEEEESIAQIANYYKNNRILVICNTIKRAKEVYLKLKESLKTSDKEKIHLLHSGFIRKDRDVKEKLIMQTGKKGSEIHEIWVSTQLVEASLDIDFDLLFTELSDLNGLFQRMGRCYRHRTLDVDYNCFVFTGGNKKCSGIGKNSVIEPEIFELSKSQLVVDGKISEKMKVEMIDRLYSIEELAATDYYKKIIYTLDYIRNITEYEYSKQTVTKLFRDISQVSAIPQSIFTVNEEWIRENMNIVNGNDGNESTKLEKIEAQEVIRDFMVPVQSRLAFGTNVFKEQLKLKNGLVFFVIDADYDDEVGISFSNTKNQEFINADDRFF